MQERRIADDARARHEVVLDAAAGHALEHAVHAVVQRGGRAVVDAQRGSDLVGFHVVHVEVFAVDHRTPVTTQAQAVDVRLVVLVAQHVARNAVVHDHADVRAFNRQVAVVVQVEEGVVGHHAVTLHRIADHTRAPIRRERARPDVRQFEEQARTHDQHPLASNAEMPRQILLGEERLGDRADDAAPVGVRPGEGGVVRHHVRVQARNCQPGHGVGVARADDPVDAVPLRGDAAIGVVLRAAHAEDMHLIDVALQVDAQREHLGLHHAVQVGVRQPRSLRQPCHLRRRAIVEFAVDVGAVAAHPRLGDVENLRGFVDHAEGRRQACALQRAGLGADRAGGGDVVAAARRHAGRHVDQLLIERRRIQRDFRPDARDARQPVPHAGAHTCAGEDTELGIIARKRSVSRYSVRGCRTRVVLLPNAHQTGVE